jgi:hypothetical protein
VKRIGTLLLTLGLYGFPAAHCVATVYHSNGSAAHVQALQNAAHRGDTIAIPAGIFTWASGVTINKGITLQGVAGATRITRAAGYRNALITITGLPSDLPVRITGIRFNSPIGQNGDLQSISVVGPYGGAWGLTQLRIDHCYFYGGMRTLLFRYRINGVIDHNTFHNTTYLFEHYGDDNYAWMRAGSSPRFGTSDSVFFEDNYILCDSALTYFDVQGDLNTGGKYVWRYNTFDFTGFTGVFGSIIGEHGNQAYWQGHDDWNRGGIMCEFYENTVRLGNTPRFRVLWFRGGRNIVANNTFYGNLNGLLVAFTEQEGIDVFPLRSSWPAEDQVNNTFIFGNTLNDQPTTAAMVGCWETASQPFIHRARDYWLRPPSPTTITNYPRPAYPSLPNHPLPYNPPITSWAPYIYPHPLVSEAPATDFNNDGKPDYVLYNATTRQTVLWYMDGNVHVSTSYGPTFPAGRSLVGVADFNGDAHTDYLLFNSATRQTMIWYLNNNVHVSSAFGPTTWAGWNVAGVADFNLDGHPDYLLFNPISGQTAIWYLNNNVRVSSTFGPTTWAGWNVAGVADFNLDGHPDYLLFNPISGQTAIWYLNNNVRVSSAFGPTTWAGWSVAGVADFNLDGHPDYLLFNPISRQTAIWYLNNNVRISSAFGPTIWPLWSLLGL